MSLFKQCILTDVPLDAGNHTLSYIDQNEESSRNQDKLGQIRTIAATTTTGKGSYDTAANETPLEKSRRNHPANPLHW